MINRLGQRLKENFHETTRDFNLPIGGLGGGTASAAYFDVSEDKIFEISKLLESRAEAERLEGMKRIIAAMSKGRNMEALFAQVVKNVVASSVEIRKLVYIYLLRYAGTNSDLLLLSINTFQKDLSDPSPLIRSMSLRVLTSIRLTAGIVMLGLKKLVNDRNPWVRKAVAAGLSKVYDMDSSTRSELLPLLQTLLGSPSPLTLGATLTAFAEICPDRLDLLHPYYRHLCRLLVDADEWGQIVALDVLTRYARTQLEKPSTAGAVKPSSTTDSYEGLDGDLAMLLDHAKPLLQSRNAATLLATAIMYFHLAPAGHTAIGQELLVRPLLRLAGSSTDEIAALAWDVVAAMAEERPWLFASYAAQLYVRGTDGLVAKRAKVRALVALTGPENAESLVREFRHYANLPEDSVSALAVSALGHCVRTQPSVAEVALRSLMRLLKSPRPALVAQSVVVLKGIVLAAAVPNPQKLVARLARQLDNITNPAARASVFWLVGQFASDPSADAVVGWEGVAPWVPDVLRKGVRGFTGEEAAAKLQVLSLAAKLLVLSPNAQLEKFAQYLFALARYDKDYDVRDRARFLAALLRGVRNTPKEEGAEEEEEEVGGVVLRREQVRHVLLSTRSVDDDGPSKSDYRVGSMSRSAGHKLSDYAELPEWTDDPTDSSLRELDKTAPQFAALPPTSFSSDSMPPSLPPPMAAVRSRSSNAPSPAHSSPASASVPHTTKSKFRDLDDFLNSSESESEESYEEETEEEEEEEEEEGETEEETDEESSSDDSD
ncbi:golgi family to vacuole transport-related protein [Trichosporon asahii var. asahii CBS 2479]|uniref:Golgi family to vacuole transport-related protein n=1 Tax=Trichosporon asahii var. asahii (strain ATCC 90039 / CBS 2479 / JCM 2466 / KCTC 7840 / NBRC 103889/ NCYC 2677 / UAMH 7654) TaxID=1186058 RepID=J5SXK7_TRIAS|nr:golgi family to vacuole transport-related protein [Trichosporon asahii var. asahii CBS 2479]EJT48056.1 golgi family to vacuole transport-related protein [Trichosporon asahii var. asahii CBS 2479]